MPKDTQGNYKVSGVDLKLTVVVGDAQRGYSNIWLDDVQLTEGRDIKDFRIAADKAISGKVLLIETQVSVVNPNSKHTSVTSTLVGGVQPQDYDTDEMAANTGDSIDHSTTITFV